MLAPCISCAGSDSDGMAGLPAFGQKDPGSDPGGSIFLNALLSALMMRSPFQEKTAISCTADSWE